MAGLGVPGVGPTNSPYLGDAPDAPEKEHKPVFDVVPPGWKTSTTSKRRRTHTVVGGDNVSRDYAYGSKTPVPFPKLEDERGEGWWPQTSKPAQMGVRIGTI